MNRNRESVFKMTPTEEKVLALFRSGMSHEEIAAHLGWGVKSYCGRMIAEAAEKERQQGIIDKKASGISSLATARGTIRMKGTK